ncbi:MAG TPA: hypothetical protein VFZ65_20370 [Planctomycetota bacterium]|nr:hypothetical protein [Planctomycetota bacterium]
MSDFQEPPDLPQPKKSRGCLFYGCLTAAVLAVVGGIGGYFLVRYALDKLVEVALEYTETTPMPLPESTMSDAEYTLLQQRIDEFSKAQDANTPATLVLDSDDLNALIARDPMWQQLRGKMHVTLQGDQVHADVALPLDEFIENVPGLSRLKGRFLNGSATLKVLLVDDILVVSLRSVQVKGESLPPEVMNSLRSRNLADRNTTGRQLDDWKKKIESIDVADGKLTIKGRPKK